MTPKLPTKDETKSKHRKQKTTKPKSKLPQHATTNDSNGNQPGDLKALFRGVLVKACFQRPVLDSGSSSERRQDSSEAEGLLSPEAAWRVLQEMTAK